MLNKYGKENPISKILRNPAVNNVAALEQFDNFLNSVGGIYKLSEAKRNGLLELAKYHSRFEVVARFAQNLDVQKDRELLKDILTYVAFRHDDLKSHGNSNEDISKYIDKVIGQFTSCFLATSDRIRISEKEMAEINVKVLLQRITNRKARAILYEKFLLDDTKVEELRELHRQLGYPTELSPETHEVQFSKYQLSDLISSLAQGRSLDGSEIHYHPFKSKEDGDVLKVILKIIGWNSKLSQEWFSSTRYVDRDSNSNVSLPYLAFKHNDANMIEIMAQYVDDKDLLKSFFLPLEELFTRFFKPSKLNLSVCGNCIKTLNALNLMFDDKTLVEALLKCEASIEVMENIIVPFLSQPRFAPYIKDAASAKDNLGCTNLDRAIAEGSDSVAIFLLKSGATPTWFNFYRNRCGDEVYSLLKMTYARSFIPTNWEPCSYSEAIADFAKMHMNSKARKQQVEIER